MTVAEAIGILEEMDPFATVCVRTKSEEGAAITVAIEDIVAIGHEAVLIYRRCSHDAR